MEEAPKTKMWIDPTGGYHYHLSDQCAFVRTPPSKGYHTVEMNTKALAYAMTEMGDGQLAFSNHLYRPCAHCVVSIAVDILFKALTDWPAPPAIREKA